MLRHHQHQLLAKLEALARFIGQQILYFWMPCRVNN